MTIDVLVQDAREELKSVIDQQHFKVPSETNRLMRKYETTRKGLSYPFELLYPSMANYRQVLLELVGCLLCGGKEDKNFAKAALHTDYANISGIQAYPDKITITSTRPQGKNPCAPESQKENKTGVARQYEVQINTQLDTMHQLYKRRPSKKVNYSTKQGKKRWDRLKELEKKYWKNDSWNSEHSEALRQDELLRRRKR